MQDVRVIGVEQGALVLATDGGTEYRLAVTGALSAQVRQADPDQVPVRRASPKDVQARVRSGSTAEQIAEQMDVDVEYVRRFEGPVLAERAFVLDSARRVAVSTPDSDTPLSFGDVIDGRLESGGAGDVRWSSYKHVENGWQVQVDYTADEVEHDARWRFDPKTSVLTPDNADAHRLSHEDDDEGLTPRLRAVEADPADHDSSRFDSGAFHVPPLDDGVTNPEVTERPQQLRAALPRIGAAPVEERAPGNETADLLEALRRRRGERESATFEERRTVTVVDVPLEHLGLDEPRDLDDEAADEAAARGDTAETPQLGGIRSAFGAPRSVSSPRSAPSASSPSSPPESAEDGARPERRKRARRSMPSWDEIVFGTKSDDDQG